MIIIYDITDNELPVAVCDSSKDAAEWLGVRQNTIPECASKGIAIKGRYITKHFINSELDAKEV